MARRLSSLELNETSTAKEERVTLPHGITLARRPLAASKRLTLSCLSPALIRSLPTAELVTPQDNLRLTRQTEIKGLVADQHLDRYVLEYTTDADPVSARWEQIVQKIDLLQMQTIEDAIDRNWDQSV